MRVRNRQFLNAMLLTQACKPNACSSRKTTNTSKASTFSSTHNTTNGPLPTFWESNVSKKANQDPHLKIALQMNGKQSKNTEPSTWHSSQTLSKRKADGECGRLRVLSMCTKSTKTCMMPMRKECL